MNTLSQYFLVVLLFVTSANAWAAPEAQTACPKNKWTQACFENSATRRQIKPQFRHRVKYQKNGLAVIHLESGELVGVNRKGDVVIPGIASGTSDYRDAEDGVAIFYAPLKNASNGKLKKCGYFQLSDFKIVIPPIYDICSGYSRKMAYVCTDCAFDCAECHSFEYYGGQGFYLNKKNEVLRHVVLPDFPRCSTVKLRGGFPANQKCRPDKE